MRPGAELALAVVLLAACGSAGGPGAASPAAVSPAAVSPGASALSERVVPFRDAGSTTQSRRGDGGPEIDAVREGGSLRITAYQGEQPTGGYAIEVERVTLAGTELRVHARFTEPRQGAMVTLALTSPAHTVLVDEPADVVVLYDSAGSERARARPR